MAKRTWPRLLRILCWVGRHDWVCYDIWASPTPRETLILGYPFGIEVRHRGGECRRCGVSYTQTTGPRDVRHRVGL